MDTRLRKWTAIFMSLALMAPALYFFSAPIRQYLIRRHMKERLEASNAQTLTIGHEALNWVRPGKELLINGRLFDVRSITAGENHSWKVSGLFDEEETAILSRLKKDQRESDSGKNALLVKMIQSWQGIPPAMEPLPEFVGHFSFPSPKGTGAAMEGFDGVLTPPPQA